MTQLKPNDLFAYFDFSLSISPCLSGKTIANIAEFKKLTLEIKSLISAPSIIYNNLYAMTLNKFMEFCQAMPLDRQKSLAYSLLLTTLKITIAALKIRRGVLFPPQSDSETIAEQEPLWTYAIFTASLFAFLPDLQKDRTIELYKSETEKLGLWHPISGRLYEPNTYYKILYCQNKTIIERSSLLSSWIGRILPVEGVRWLAEDNEIWNTWWDSITQTKIEKNNLWQLLKKSRDLALDVNSEISSKNSHSQSFFENELPSTIVDFNHWIIKNCSSGGELNGKKNFLRVDAGVIIRFKKIADFLKSHPQYAPTNIFLEQFDRYLKKENNSLLSSHIVTQEQGPELTINGILLLNDFLIKPLKSLPANNQFIEDLS